MRQIVNSTLFSCLLLSSSCAVAQKQDSRIEFMNQADIIVKRDISALYDATYKPISFQSATKLEDTVHDFIYGRNQSVWNVLRQGHLKVVTKQVGQFEGLQVVWAIYIPSKFWKEYVRAPNTFLQSEYLKKYAACAFIKTPSGWKFMESLCFAESDDPFSEDP